MKRHDSGMRFWTAGCSVFEDELLKEEREHIAPLKEDLRTTTDPVRENGLRHAIEAAKAEFKAKRKNAGYSLFTKV